MSPVLSLDRGGGRRIAYRRIDGRGPTLLWLGGFASDMEGSKAQALAAFAGSQGRAFVRFDYFGHGASAGRFRDGRVGGWRDDALAVMDRVTEGPVVLVGSSMGAWLACLLALARPERAAGLLLLAPALDFTERLLKPSLPDAAHAAFAAGRPWRRPSAYDPEGLEIDPDLIAEGAGWLLLPGPIAISAPVRVVQGGADAEVPWRYALETVEAFQSDDLCFTLIRDADHRLSRPQDVARMLWAVGELLEAASA